MEMEKVGFYAHMWSKSFSHTLFQAVGHMHVRTERRSHDVTPSEVSRYLPVSCLHQTLGSLLHLPAPFWYGLPPSVNETLPITRLSSSLFHLSLLKSNLSPTRWSFFFFSFRGWIASLPCPIPFVPQMEKWAPRLFPACCDTARLLGLYGGRDKR